MLMNALRSKGSGGCRRSDSPAQRAATISAPRLIGARNAEGKSFVRKLTRKRRQDRADPIEPPQFANQFLASTHDAFTPRLRKWRRSIVGPHSIQLDELQPVYWFIVCNQPRRFCSVALTVEADQTGILTIRNSRGRNLLKLRSIQLPDYPKAIVEAFEWTMNTAHSLSGGEMDNKSRVEFVERWKPSEGAKGLKRS